MNTTSFMKITQCIVVPFHWHQEWYLIIQLRDLLMMKMCDLFSNINVSDTFVPRKCKFKEDYCEINTNTLSVARGNISVKIYSTVWNDTSFVSIVFIVLT